MWKDPIIEELHRVRAAIAAKHAGLKGLHSQALKIQKDLRARGVAVVNLHRKARVHEPRSTRQGAARKARIAV
jgi:predicted nuclease with RNAse H fold